MGSGGGVMSGRQAKHGKAPKNMLTDSLNQTDKFIFLYITYFLLKQIKITYSFE